MTRYDVTFRHNRPSPYIQSVFAYECDGSQGMLEFDGYYYVNDTADPINDELDYVSRYSVSLPKEESVIVIVFHSTPPQIISDELYEYNVDVFDYKIVVERREKIRDTSEYSTIEDGNEEMNVCFFPTCRQRIYFRVIETLVSDMNTTIKIRRH